MIVYLYKNNSDPRTVSKNIFGEIAIEATIKGECSLTHPQLLFQRGERGYYSNYNYCYIPELNRYYYIDNISFLPGNYAVFDTSIDVLMSHSSAIRSLTAMIERQEYLYNKYINDDDICMTQGSVAKAIDVGSVTDGTTRIYMTAIGAVEEAEE